ncbi:hypothetical protein WISP_78243 [Willisornis vidua]|uniref:Uncharacterized protein n=1 Tax=Willisornis vidua TaxID=1566151 RepID=A0ABQ9D5Z9_9PASS|nr:hypothetical protein WISP_78243 [Willisornis vidua]
MGVRTLPKSSFAKPDHDDDTDTDTAEKHEHVRVPKLIFSQMWAFSALWQITAHVFDGFLMSVVPVQVPPYNLTGNWVLQQGQANILQTVNLQWAIHGKDFAFRAEVGCITGRGGNGDVTDVGERLSSGISGWDSQGVGINEE